MGHRPRWRAQLALIKTIASASSGGCGHGLATDQPLAAGHDRPGLGADHLSNRKSKEPAGDRGHCYHDQHRHTVEGELKRISAPAMRMPFPSSSERRGWALLTSTTKRTKRPGDKDQPRIVHGRTPEGKGHRRQINATMRPQTPGLDSSNRMALRPTSQQE